MSEKRYRVRFEQEDGRGEIVNEKGVELTAREVVDLLNEQQTEIDYLKDMITVMKLEIRYNNILEKVNNLNYIRSIRAIKYKE